MHFRRLTAVALCALLLLLSCSIIAFAQGGTDATPAQRLEVMRSRLETMKRSLNSAIAAMNAQQSGDPKKASADDPATRLRGLEQEVSTVMGDVSNARSKVDRSERLEPGLLDRLETSVADLQKSVETGLQNTAEARNISTVAPAKKKKKGRFFGLLGGGGSDDRYDELTGTVAPGRDRVLFEEAAKEVRKGRYDTGRLLFNTIITTYPDSPYLPMAKLAIADSFYLEGLTSSLIQAAAAYQDWLTFFPTHPLADDVMLKLAEAEMRQMGLANRDVTRARKAEQRLKVLLQQFPDTPLRKEAEQRLLEVQENLAMHNLLIARFYYDRNEQQKGGLKGAQSRLLEITKLYPQFSYMDEVLYRLGALYVEEEEPDEAMKFYAAVVRDYPNSEFAEKAKDQLTKIGGAIPDADPIKKGLPPPDRPTRSQKIFSEVFGTVSLTINKNGVLISKDDKSGNDLIDIVARNQGELPSSATPNAPTTPVQRRPPARPLAPATQTPAANRTTTGGGGITAQPASSGPPPGSTTTTAPSTVSPQQTTTPPSTVPTTPSGSRP